MFDDVTKLKCLEREIQLRRKVYPRFVAAGKMTQPEASREINVLEDIANDYREKIGRDLFTTDSPRQELTR